MKTFPIYDELHELHAFEISNTFTTRRTVTRIAGDIPNVELLKKPKFLSWFRDGGTFCVFSLNNKKFEIEEPFGDNSRYIISSNPPGHCPELLEVEAAFSRA